MATFKDDSCTETENSDVDASEEKGGGCYGFWKDERNIECWWNFTDCHQYPEKWCRTLIGQGQAPEDNPNSSNDAEVATEEGHEVPGVHSGEESEEKADTSIKFL